MVAESLEEYVVEMSAEAYEYSWEQAPVAIMDPGRKNEKCSIFSSLDRPEIGIYVLSRKII